jgi:GT2 family glycosyltransferase
VKQLRRASVVIDNYNYGRFLRESIDSALAQTYPHVEVIVVDDGSTDDSREIIGGYGASVVPVLKDNGGQGSAFNAGFARSSGEIVIFLDADDVLRPTALESAAPLFDDPSVVTVQWCLTVIDASGNVTRRQIPQRRPPDGDLRETALRRGPDVFRWSPTSGTAWSRSYLDRILPLPEELYMYGTDSYLFQLAPFFGKVATLESSESFYRLHGRNDSRTIGFENKLRRSLAFYADYSARALRHCEENGWAVDPGTWRANSWWCQLALAVEEIEEVVPPGGSFILVDENTWGMKEEFRTRRVIPFTEKDGRYWGPPGDDVAAAAELERSREAGADFIVFTWQAFWMLDHFGEFHGRLRSTFPCVLSSDRLRVFRLS